MDTEQDLIAQARALSGENYIGSRPQLPTIKFMGRGSKHGDEGNFYLLTKNQASGELDSMPLGTTIEITILRVRKYLDNGKSDEQRKFTYEFDSTALNQVVALKIGNQETELTTYQEIRKAHPEMKYHEVLYVLYDGKPCKLKVSGGSLGGFFKYIKTFPSSDTFMRYKTILSGEAIAHSEGDYHALTFTRGEVNPDFRAIVEGAKNLNLPEAPQAALPAGSEVVEESSGEAPPVPVMTDADIKDLPF